MHPILRLIKALRYFPKSWASRAPRAANPKQWHGNFWPHWRWWRPNPHPLGVLIVKAFWFGLGEFQWNNTLKDGWRPSKFNPCLLLKDDSKKSCKSFFPNKGGWSFKRLPPTQIGQIVRQNEGCLQGFQCHHLFFSLGYFRRWIGVSLCCIQNVCNFATNQWDNLLLHMVWYSGRVSLGV